MNIAHLALPEESWRLEQKQLILVLNGAKSKSQRLCGFGFCVLDIWVCL